MTSILTLLKNELDREVLYLKNAKTTLITSQEIAAKVLNKEFVYIKYETSHLNIVEEYHHLYKILNKEFNYLENKIIKLKKIINLLEK